jgi:hypothetical protein
MVHTNAYFWRNYKEKMKRIVGLIILVAIGFGVYWAFFHKEKKREEPKQEALVVKSADNAFDSSMQFMMDNYYAFKDAYVKSDTALIGKTTAQLIASLRAISFKGVKADTAIIETAKGLKDSIVNQAANVFKQKNIEDKRHSLQAISDVLYDMVRTVKYNKDTIYQIHCPMAFNSAGANWLSRDTMVVNPYFNPSQKMTDCGGVQDSYPNK